MTAPALLAVALAALAAGCRTPSAARAEEVRSLDQAWKQGRVEEDDLERMLDGLQHLRDRPSAGREGQVLALDLAGLVLSNPSALVRSEALASLWAQLEPGVPEPWRVDELDLDGFHQRTTRLDQLLQERQDEQELLGLARWLGAHRFGPERAAEAVAQAQVVLSRALGPQDVVTRAFAQEAAACSWHAAALVTLRAGRDRAQVVRRAALEHAARLGPSVALPMLVRVLDTEPDPLVVLDALAHLEGMAAELPAADLRRLLWPLRDSADVAVQHRVRALLERLRA